jgi:hypothetical protein
MKIGKGEESSSPSLWNSSRRKRHNREISAWHIAKKLTLISAKGGDGELVYWKGQGYVSLN